MQKSHPIMSSKTSEPKKRTKRRTIIDVTLTIGSIIIVLAFAGTFVALAYGAWRWVLTL